MPLVLAGKNWDSEGVIRGVNLNRTAVAVMRHWQLVICSLKCRKCMDCVYLCIYVYLRKVGRWETFQSFERGMMLEVGNYGALA